MKPRMLRRIAPLAVLASLAVVAACSGSTTSSSGGAPDQDAAPGDDAGGGGEGGGGDDGGGGGTDVPPPSACPTSQHKTLVIVGDSISDVGSGSGVDEQPFYRTLLVKNDDAKYPEWKGFDLTTCWSLAAANVVKASKGGAVATVPSPNTPSDMGILVNQVKSLPTTLEGPVLVVGTIGGNDVTGGLVAVLSGNTAQAQKNIDNFAAGFGAAMADLTATDRFGAGVKVDVVMTNIYDPSGGSGHFYYAPEKQTCPGALGFWPDGTATDPELAKWNTAMTTEAAKHPGVKLVDMHGPFVKHAVSTATGTNWFHDDCIHPNALGHNAIRGILWAGLVTLP
jgi:lysophospholipase L1-like esterase